MLGQADRNDHRAGRCPDERKALGAGMCCCPMRVITSGATTGKRSPAVLTIDVP